MKRILVWTLVLMICAVCFASCAQMEQKIGQTVSVAAVEAVANELSEQGVTCELAGEEQLAQIQEGFAGTLAEEYGIEPQGEMTAVLMGEYTNPENDDWVLYWAFGFSMNTQTSLHRVRRSWSTVAIWSASPFPRL